METVIVYLKTFFFTYLNQSRWNSQVKSLEVESGQKGKDGEDFFFVFWSSTFKWFRKTAEKDGSGAELMPSGAVYSEKEE